MAQWFNLGRIDELKQKPLQQREAGRAMIALSYHNGSFGAISAVCNHVGGPLGEGHLDGAYVVCPWHHWKFHCQTGGGEPGYEEDKVPSYELKEEDGQLFVNLESATKRNKLPHEKHPLERSQERKGGPIRVLGISTTVMDPKHPRYSTSDDLLECALECAARMCGAETKRITLNDLTFRACEGYYSKSAQACTWPCSITQMDKEDQMEVVYEGIVFWADVILIATPIRWGAASSLYYKMTERLNCVQNQITIRNRVLLRNKVASFIVTGGQDNVQAVAGQMMMFFGEIGCISPQFPFVAHSRGWDAEDMEQNVRIVRESESLREGTRALVRRSVKLAETLLSTHRVDEKLDRGGRKAHHL